MRDSQPSRTAHRVALRRAAHQLLDDPLVFKDALALSIVGAEAAAALRARTSSENNRISRALRAFMAVRSRYAEDQLAAAVAHGVRQYVVLGAGQDTFAYRNPYLSAGLRVFEVDHPATQAWKRELLSAAAIPIPAALAIAPVNFERETLGDGLQCAGFRCDVAAFFSWLGVTPYLSREAFQATLRFVVAMPGPSGIVFDYAVARSSLKFLERMALDALSWRVAAGGEPFQLFFRPQELVSDLKRMGFAHIEDLGRKEMNARYFTGRSDRLEITNGLAHLLYAQVAPSAQKSQ
jgi:methyltransferase (TIGR00027 family)